MTSVGSDTRSVRRCPSVCIVTSHGRQLLAARGDERLMDVLRRYGVPWSAVSIYLAPASGGDAQVSPCLDIVLQELRDVSEILIYFNRNVNPFLFSLEHFKLVE